MEGKEFSAKSVEEATLEGLKELNLSIEEADVEVIDEPVKGLFGIMTKKARVKITKKLTEAQRTINFLDGLFEKMNVAVETEIVEEGEKLVINLLTTQSAMLIGYRGEVLDAIQSLAGAVANTGNKVYKRVVIDCEGYRQKREDTLVNLAKKLEQKAVKFGKNVNIEPMSAYERRVIHSALASSADVTTTSDGKEPNRFVVIVPNVKKEYKNDRGGYKKDFKKDGNKGGYKKDFKKDGYKKDGYKKDYKKNDRYSNRDKSNDGEVKDIRAPKKDTFSFGTFLGNSKNTEE